MLIFTLPINLKLTIMLIILSVLTNQLTVIGYLATNYLRCRDTRRPFYEVKRCDGKFFGLYLIRLLRSLRNDSNASDALINFG